MTPDRQVYTFAADETLTQAGLDVPGQKSPENLLFKKISISARNSKRFLGTVLLMATAVACDSEASTVRNIPESSPSLTDYNVATIASPTSTVEVTVIPQKSATPDSSEGDKKFAVENPIPTATATVENRATTPNPTQVPTPEKTSTPIPIVIETPAPTPTPSATATPEIPKIEKAPDFQASAEVLIEANKRREAMGLKPAQFNSALQTVAMQHAQDLYNYGINKATREGIVHSLGGSNSQVRVQNAGINASAAEVVIAQPSSIMQAFSAYFTMERFMASPDHAKIITDAKWTQSAYGCYKGPNWENDLTGKLIIHTCVGLYILPK